MVFRVYNWLHDTVYRMVVDPVVTHLFVLGLESPPPGSPYIFDSRREGEKKEPNSEGFLGHPALFTYQGHGKARH